jgi:hypothetical protein
VSADQLNNAQVVLQGFRQALSEAAILALSEKLRGRKDLQIAYRESGRRAEERANEHPLEDASTG